MLTADQIAVVKPAYTSIFAITFGGSPGLTLDLIEKLFCGRLSNSEGAVR